MRKVWLKRDLAKHPDCFFDKESFTGNAQVLQHSLLKLNQNKRQKLMCNRINQIT